MGQRLRVTDRVGSDGGFTDAFGLVQQSRGQHVLRPCRDAPVDLVLRQIEKDEKRR